MEILSDDGLLHVERVMGTTVTIDLRDRHLTQGELARALVVGLDVLHDADRMFSTYRPDSAVSQIRAGSHGPDLLPADVVSVLVQCTAARERTRGWFDPWAMPGGFDPTGLVKGWAAQQALRAMARWGVQHALVNAGGDVAVLGDASAAGDGSGWNVGVQHPFAASGLLTIVNGTDLGVATSGGYERGSLAVDPATGRPVHRLASVTVIAADLALADACATGASAHGPDAVVWLEGLHGVEALLLTAQGLSLRTSGWDGVTAAPGRELRRHPS